MSTERGSRFESWGRGQALAVSAALIILVIWGIVAGTQFEPDAPSDRVGTNVDLYTAIVDDMDDGSSYYAAVDSIQADRGYPTRPFVTVRQPGLAYVTTWLGGLDVMTIALLLLAAVALVALLIRLEGAAPSRAAWWGASFLAALAIVPLIGTDNVVLHECWVGLLVSLGLALQTPRRWRAGIAAVLAAALLRELVLPVFAAMALYEWVSGRRRRSCEWAGAAVLFLGLLGLHAAKVADAITPSTSQSDGWLQFGGWPFLVDSIRFSSVFSTLPDWVAALAVPLAFLGWFSRRGDFAERVTMVVFTYACAFVVVGQTENVYWGLIFVVVLLPGLAFAPSALFALVRAVRSTPVAPSLAGEAV